jgi:hypothetical protein
MYFYGPQSWAEENMAPQPGKRGRFDDMSDEEGMTNSS